MNSLRNDSRTVTSILIIDDNQGTAAYLTTLMQEEGFQTQWCNSGTDALYKIEKGTFDLVLLDVIMPEIDGITLAKQIKEKIDEHDFLPIILVTALSDAENKIAGLEFADDYITKPFSGDELLARVRSLLRIRYLHGALVRSKRKFQCMYENFPHLYISIDEDRKIVDCNRLFCETFDCTKEEIVGKSLLTFFTKDDNTELEKFLDSLVLDILSVKRQVFSLQVAASSELHFFDMKAVYIREADFVSVLIAMEDVTQRLRLEDEQKIARRQLYRSARLASIGTLASGVAHEINNPLTAILGFSSALLDRMKKLEPVDPGELEQYLEIINNETLRCRDIVENLSRFARDTDFKISTVSLTSCVNDAVKLINNRAVRKGILVSNQIVSEVYVAADNGKLEQVLVNILANCVDFCRHNDSVVISAIEHSSSKYVTVKISDTGPGINAEILPKIFDPFFTTKEVGQGIGMGLAITHKLIEECNGTIDVFSEVDRGTTVRLQIPRPQMSLASQRNTYE